ncbi:hypothetical protein HW450_10315 [Corynebacterium hindlerae]|uniref:Uncharacterized protein n=1 Tax=Corynebacterium hindlerae TaxID=699041 RepID=A0A7G5FDN6_9CORY|nr:hypothetical protein [Corynebacterium hindlerae]QMV84727.1 hypothetical protein HW450_10315 [Corynebacterium hindlerae]
MIIQPFVRIDGVPPGDTVESWDTEGHAVLADLSIKWGRINIFSHADPSTATFTIRHRTGKLHRGYPIPGRSRVDVLITVNKQLVTLFDGIVRNITTRYVSTDKDGDIWDTEITAVDPMGFFGSEYINKEQWFRTYAYKQAFDLQFTGRTTRNITFWVPDKWKNESVRLFSEQDIMTKLTAAKSFYHAFDAGTWTRRPGDTNVYPTGRKSAEVFGIFRQSKTGALLPEIKVKTDELVVVNTSGKRQQRPVDTVSIDGNDVRSKIEFTFGPRTEVSALIVHGFNLDDTETQRTIRPKSTTLPGNSTMSWNSNLVIKDTTRPLLEKTAEQLVQTCFLPEIPELTFISDEFTEEQIKFWIHTWESNIVGIVKNSKLQDVLRSIGFAIQPTISPIGGTLVWNGKKWLSTLKCVWVGKGDTADNPLPWKLLDNSINWHRAPFIDESVTWADLEHITQGGIYAE